MRIDQLNKKIKHVLVFAMCCTIPAVLAAQQRNTFNITAYGAKPDSSTNNTAAIQQAIDDAAKKGGRVVVPAGNFVTGVLQLKSDVELHLEKNAVLLATTSRLDYGTASAAALIAATAQHHIAITGEGTIDGRGKAVVQNVIELLSGRQLTDRQWPVKIPEERNRPKLLLFTECTNVTIKGIHLINGASWIQEYRRCNHVVIDHVTVLSNEYWNNDGIDINNCKNVRITHCDINASDDAICLKSETEIKDYCENIFIAHCRLRSSANAFKIGTGSHGGFRKIKVKHLYIYDTYRSAVALESVDGAFLENVDIKKIFATNTGNAIFIRLGHRNNDSAYSTVNNIRIQKLYVQVPAGKPDAGYPMEGPLLKYPPGIKPVTGSVQSVSPWNNSGKDTAAIIYRHNVFPSSVTGLPGHAVQNIGIKKVQVDYASVSDTAMQYFPMNAAAQITEAEKAYPEFSMFGELPVWGLFIRHADGIQLKKIKFVMNGNDYRNAVLLNDVQHQQIKQVTAEGKFLQPTIVEKN
ncbi:MAG: glycoside hydrolase family 28 [Bacteroidetes bacterium]|nr:glycoside hydrolase family 28 [Bacteroidota bacterium]